MTLGTEKWFDAQRGYGFIQPDDGSKDTFVHVSAVERAGWGTLSEGKNCPTSSRPGRTARRPRAILRWSTDRPSN